MLRKLILKLEVNNDMPTYKFITIKGAHSVLSIKILIITRMHVL